MDGIQYASENWPWAGVFFIWYFRQVGDIPHNKAEYYFRMVDPDFTMQPVYKAIGRPRAVPGAGAPGPRRPRPATATPATGGA